MALPNTNTSHTDLTPVQRVRIWYGFLMLVIAVFVVRLFYVQIIRYDHYKNAALSDQLKQYQIPATRGIISAHDGSGVVPIVLNQQLYTLYADPTYIKHPEVVGAKVADIIVGKAQTYTELLKTKQTRYVVLAKKITNEQQTKVLQLKYPGVGAVAQDYRTYPQGALAAQELGFVTDDGKGKYGVEQALNKRLSGTPGQLKAITDISGVPLAASRDNTEVAPKNGEDVTLTIDLAMQQQLEAALKQGAEKTKAVTSSALILDVNTGAVKAMANYPTYDPAKYFDVSDPNVFQNGAVSDPIEPGSIMKTLTTAAGLDQGVIQAGTTYYDPAHWLVDGFTIRNIEEDGGPGTKSLTDLLNLSLNTGATWELMQMGGGTINAKARNAWYDYLTKHYMFGKQTGIEQGYEAPGLVTGPSDTGSAIDLTYAESTFGQAILTTPIQMAAALAAVVNGGTYYQPRLVDQTTDASGKTTTVAPKIVRKADLKPSTGQALIPMLQYSIDHHGPQPAFDQTKYTVGGKTGTAQLAVNGIYSPDQFNGTYIGFVGGSKIQYVICVYSQKPIVGNGTYAGTVAAQPIFVNLAHMLINNSYIVPKQ
jgi:stage V sporulation protein D (sporulation-specific penicillin-binding protein)